MGRYVILVVGCWLLLQKEMEKLKMRKELHPLYAELRRKQREELKGALGSARTARAKGYITDRMESRIEGGKATTVDYVRRIVGKIPWTKALDVVGRTEMLSHKIDTVVIDIHYSNGRGAYGRQCRTLVNMSGPNHFVNYISNYTKGSGYEKPSTAAANALNMAPEIRYLLYKRKAEILANPAAWYPMGANYESDYLPSFNGGVGMAWIAGILKDLGLALNYQGKTLGGDEIYIFRRQDGDGE